MRPALRTLLAAFALVLLVLVPSSSGAETLSVSISSRAADLPLLVITVLAGTLGFAAVGTLFAAMSANTRAREIFLPVLLLPVSVPVMRAFIAAPG